MEDRENDMDDDRDEDDERHQAIFAQMWRQMLQGRPRGANTNENLIGRLKLSQTLKSAKLEEAFLKIPREYFVTQDLKDDAYIDHPLRFAKMGFNISAPHMYAMCLENLNIQPGDKILDIGSGCGYLTILAGYLTGPNGLVHGLDLYDHIIEFAQNNIKSFLNEKGAALEMSFDHIKFIKRNCFLPSPDPILYDKIHVGACCPDAKIQELYNMLAVKGILVTPYGDRLIKAVKGEDGKMTITTLVEVRYSDLLLPSSAEIKEACKEIEIAKANKIVVPQDNRKILFGNMVNNKLCSDIIFEVRGRPVYAHKIVLALQNGISFGQEIKESVVKIEDFSSEGFLSMLHFLYTGNLNASPEYMEELLKLAQKYQLHNLEQVVTAKLQGVPVPEVHSFVTEVSKLVSNDLFSDVKIQVKDTIIPAHKFVLVAQSDHFRKMFSGGFKECRDGIIKITDCTPDILFHLLQFIYSGNCSINEQNCFGLLEQANFFQLSRLTAMCEIFWYHNIDIENAASILEFANHFNASQLKQFAMEFIFKNVKEVTKTHAWKELDVDLISSVLIASVERGK